MNILQWTVVISSVFGLACANPVNSECGIKDVSDLTESNQKNEWPWLASLVYKSEDENKNGKFFCSGTLISLKSVLTAAHCMQNKVQEKRLNPSDFEVQLGRHNLSDENELQGNAKVLEPIIIIAMHPDWNPTDNDNYRYDADIALLIAEKAIQPSLYIRPICLPDRDLPNINASTVGWVFTGDDEDKVKKEPRQAQVERVSQEECFLEDHRLEKMTSNRTLCVKAVDGQPCSGDSGGGLFVKSGNVWSIHGIVSSGLIVENCPITRHSLYTKLSVFGDWIKEGIEQFYPLKFSLFYFDRSYHLSVPSGTLRKGAFLSSVGGSVNDVVKDLSCINEDLRYWPNDVGHVFPNLLKLWAQTLQIRSIERANLKNMEKLEILSFEGNLIEEIPFDCFYELKKVEEINISRNRLKAIHPETFTKNPSLINIWLSHNQFESIKSKNFNNKNVKILILDHNQLESIAIDAFDGMDSLDKLYLHNNKLAEIHSDTFLKNPKLTEILLGFNQIESIQPKSFFNNQNVKKLELNNNQLESIAIDAFDGMDSLDKLYLHNNKLTEIHSDTFLKNPKLTEILLGFNQIKSIQPKSFFNNQNVEKLELNNNQLESIAIDAFDGMDNLDKLYLHNNKLTEIHSDTFLKNPKLTEILLGFNQIESIQPKSFFNNQNVEKLELNNNQLESIPYDAFDGMDNLRKIRLNSNKLTEIHSDTFLNNTKLTEIFLDHNQIESIKPKNFKNQNVKWLFLNNNQLKSIPFDAFDGMDSLERIVLSANKLTEIHSDTFLNNPELSFIMLNENQIQSLPSGLLRNIRHLNHLNFRHNKITKIETTFEHTQTNYYFSNNKCVDKFYYPYNVNTLNEMNAELKRLCE